MSRKSERGQTMIYFVTVLAVLMLLGLWLFDYNTAAVSRIRAQNAADASALAAAQWQAKSLNAVGEINLVKAINTLLENVPPGTPLQTQLTGLPPSQAYATIQTSLDSLQARVGFVGPALAMVAAQQAAKNNGIPINTVYTGDMRNHANLVSLMYQNNFSAPGWGGTYNWADSYSRMLNYMADEGVAAAADNASYYYGSLSASAQAHQYLLSKSFYQAISVQNWCFLEDLLLGGYDDFTFWGDITPLGQSVAGSEFFGLGLELASSDSLLGAGGLSDVQIQQLRGYFEQELANRNLPLHTDWPQFIPAINWSVYSASTWGTWDKAATYASSLVALPRPVYDYSGCDAVTAISVRNNVALALTNRSSGWTGWLVGGGNQVAFADSVSRLEGLQGSSDLDVKANAAAKPFGQLPNISEPAYTFRIVLPVYQEVRLIPVALASAYGNSDAQWLIHRLEHLPFNGPGDTVAYTRFGPDSLPGDCFYCQQLKTWEIASFRQQGIDWLTAIDPITGLKVNTCIQVGGGGGGPGTGGVPYAH